MGYEWIDHNVEKSKRGNWHIVRDPRDIRGIAFRTDEFIVILGNKMLKQFSSVLAPCSGRVHIHLIEDDNQPAREIQFLVTS